MKATRLLLGGNCNTPVIGSLGDSGANIEHAVRKFAAGRISTQEFKDLVKHPDHAATVAVISKELGEDFGDRIIHSVTHGISPECFSALLAITELPGPSKTSGRKYKCSVCGNELVVLQYDSRNPPMCHQHPMQRV